jgi:hypothetical protein
MKKFALLLFLAILLSGCYQTTLTQVRLGDWGYQFLEPEGICRKRALPEGVELYCPEGRITITFPLQDEVGSVEDVLADALGEDAILYTISEWDALGPELTVAELPLETQMEDESRPKYVAAKPFGTDRIAVIEGLLYSGAFEAEFERAFRTVSTRLQPADRQETTGAEE